VVPAGGDVTTIETADGLALEAAWSVPEGPPRRVVVLCHPDPRQRGTMQAPLIKSLAAAMAGAGFAVLRFNFRGVGRSEGIHGDGVAEIADVAAAVTTAADAHPEVPLGLAGWSFGAVVSLRYQAASSSALRYAGIAPPVWMPGTSGRTLPDPRDLPPAQRLFVLGDRDQFTAVDDLREYAGSIGARMEVLKGSDHFFFFREDAVASILTGFFGA
jgi:alpha/beta superfamily hydrolase